MTNDNPYAWVSDLNLRPEVLGESDLPKVLKIYDTTLRDGEQTVGVSLNKHEKLEIARTLDDLGVDRIEAGMPVVSKEDRQAVEMIAKDGLRAEVWGFSRCVKTDIDTCADCGAKAVVIEIPTSAYKMQAYGMKPETVLERIEQNLNHAKDRGLYIAFFAVDATRSDLGFLADVYALAVERGQADEVVIVDTLGVATPETMYFLTKQLRSWVSVPIMVHCHNDFGLGIACTMSALKAGAQWAHTTVNGLGEKCGNVDTAEVALVANLLYGMHTNIKFDRLFDAAQLVATLSKVPLSPLKPVVGENVFKRESGAVIAQLMTYPPSVEGYSPELIGRKREIVLGKKSGKNSVEYVLQKLGLTATPEQIVEILERVKLLSIETKGPVSDDQFKTIFYDTLTK